MTEMVLTKKTFIGQGTAGHLAYPGDVVDVDAKGQPIPAGSSPVGSLSDEQLQAELDRRRAGSAPAAAASSGDKFGDNLAKPADTNTGAQPLAIAPMAPHAPSATQPQGIPPGTVQVGDRFIRPAPAEAPAAVEEVVANTAEQIEAVSAEASKIADLRAGGSDDGDAAIEGGVKDVSARVATMSAAELDAAEAAENDREVPRKGVLSAIEKRRGALNDEA